MKKASKALFNFAGATGIISLISSLSLSTLSLVLFFLSIVGILMNVYGGMVALIVIFSSTLLLSIVMVLLSFSSQLCLFVGTIVSFLGSLKKKALKIINMITGFSGLFFAFAFIGFGLLMALLILGIPWLRLIFGSSSNMTIQTYVYNGYDYYYTKNYYLSALASPGFFNYLLYASLIFVILAAFEISSLLSVVGGITFFALTFSGSLRDLIEMKKEKKEAKDEQIKEEETL